MKVFFYILTAVLFVAMPAVGIAQNKNRADCYAGCENQNAPARGTGRSACWVTFVAPQGAKALKVQIFAADRGILRNAKGEIAIRGGENETTRVAVDCNAFRNGDTLIACATFGERERNIRFLGDAFKKLLPQTHRRGGLDVQL